MDPRVRNKLTIVACVTPLLARLAFKAISRIGLVDWSLQLIKPIVGTNSSPDMGKTVAGLLFDLGWIGWCGVCAAWCAWRIVKWRPPETRLGRSVLFLYLIIIVFVVFVWGGAAFSLILAEDPLRLLGED